MKYLPPSKRLIRRFFILGLFIILFTNYSNAQTFFCDLEDSVRSDIWIGQQTIDSGFAHSGIFMSVTDSIIPYGLGVEMEFSEEKKGVNTFVTVEGWVKSSVSFPNALYVVTISDGKNELFWQGIRLDTIITNKDKWFGFSRSFKIPASITKKATFKCYLWNAGGKDTIAIDDLKVDFEEVKNPTYLPDYNISKKNVQVEEALYSNLYYSVLYDEVSERIFIESKSGDKIIGDVRSINQYVVDGEDVKQLTSFALKGIKSRKGIATLRFVAKNKYSSKKMIISCNDYSPEIEINVEEKYKKELECRRSAILIESKQEVSEVFRSNRKSDKDNFQQEYWLDKQGVLFGEAENSLLIYNVPDISSLQLATNDNLLLINLDYEKDHPFFHFPLDKDTFDLKMDWSKSVYKKGDRKSNSFSIVVGTQIKSIPRLMKNPDGYLATYIWSEHADFSNIRTNRAVYFGSENITTPKDAIGGFVKYNIPVTKSVFYHNPDHITNTKASKGLFTGLESTIRSDTSFYKFLETIHKKGTEICLHTPEQFTTKKEWLEEALKFMEQRFGSPTWIDHGNNNGPQNNREDLVCDGTLKDSPHYALDLWKKYGVKYVHNAFYEEMGGFGEWQFQSSIENPYSGFGDMLPNPEYFQHISRSGLVYHWTTKNAFFIENEDLWDYCLNINKLNDFIEHWGFEINHCYPAWVYPYKGFWTYDADSIIVAQNGFNQSLERMAALRDEKKLNVCTIKDFLDYRLSAEKVKYEVLPDGRIQVTNTGAENIDGLSFATKGKAVLVDRLKPAQKTSGNDIIFWFDIKAGETATIRVVD